MATPSNDTETPSPPQQIKKTTNKCSGERLSKASLVGLSSAWVLSYDERSISKTFTAKNWDAAMQFLNALTPLANAANHHPDFSVSNYRHVRIVLTTHSIGGYLTVQDVELAHAIDTLQVELSPQWKREQAVIDETDEAVTFDETHFALGLNGDFEQPDAEEKFAGKNEETPGIFENSEMRDIAAAKEEIVKALRLAPGSVVADIGAGTGLLEPLIAQAVGSEGKVLAVELSPVFRTLLAKRCHAFPNIHIVDNPTDRDPQLPADGSIDLVLLVDVYHHLMYPQAVMRKIRSSLHRHGALVVVDFHRDPARIQSHDENWVYQHLRADQATFTREIERTGFVQVEQVDVPGLPENYFLVFRKRPIPLAEPGAGWTC